MSRSDVVHLESSLVRTQPTHAPFFSPALYFIFFVFFFLCCKRCLKVMTKYVTAPLAFPGTPEWGMMLNVKEDLAKDAWLQ